MTIHDKVWQPESHPKELSHLRQAQACNNIIAH